MTGFELTEDQRLFVTHVEQIAHTRLMPLLASAPHGRVNRPLLAAMGRHGLLRRLFADDGSVGRRAAAAMDLCLLRESLAAISPAAETVLALQGLGGCPFLCYRVRGGR
jgi:hypothetical protein